jgi:hypothetical protein
LAALRQVVNRSSLPSLSAHHIDEVHASAADVKAKLSKLIFITQISIPSLDQETRPRIPVMTLSVQRSVY